MVMAMATSMQLDAKVRDELAETAERDVKGVPLGEAVRLVREHKINQIVRRFDELRVDPDEWAAYQAEAALTDKSGGDGLPSARAEYPELNY